MRRRHGAGQHVDRITLSGHQQGDLGIRPVAGGEEGQAMRVVPMQVAEQNGSPKWPALHQRAQPLQAGARIEHQRGRCIVAGQRHAGGIAPVSTSPTALHPAPTDSTPPSKRNSTAPAWPCSTSVWPEMSFRNWGLAPPRIICSESSRSRAVSTCVTKAGESWLPQGVRSPKMSPDQLLKSVTATLLTSLPEAS